MTDENDKSIREAAHRERLEAERDDFKARQAAHAKGARWGKRALITAGVGVLFIIAGFAAELSGMVTLGRVLGYGGFGVATVSTLAYGVSYGIRARKTDATEQRIANRPANLDD